MSATVRRADEELLASVFAEVLGRPQIGREENIFALGGFSLPDRRQLTVRLAACLRERLGLDIPQAALLARPTVAGLAAWIGASRPAAVVPSIERAASERAASHRELPLSYGQQRLWFLDQLEPGSTAYNIPLALELVGDLDPPTLEASLRTIEQRHETLRTRFGARDGQPFQWVAPCEGVALPVIDLSSLPQERRKILAARLAEQQCRQPFDLESGPLWRSRLLRLDGATHRLVLTLHHIICDGWSIEVLLRELGACYGALAAGGTGPALPALSIQYGDYALWQHRSFDRDALSAPLEMWKRRLAGHVSALDLAVDRTPPALRSAGGAALSIRLSTRLLEAAREHSRRQGATLFMTLLAVFEVLLARYTGRREFLVGTPVANRTRTELKGLIGFFANTLVLPATVASEASFRALLAQVREVAVAALSHQDLPLEMLVRELAPDRNLSHLSLLQAVFTFHNAPTAVPAIPGLGLRLVEVHGGGSMFDLTLAGLEARGGLRVHLEYSTELFSRAAAHRLLGHFATLLEGSVTDPDQRIDALPLLTEAERHQVLIAYNDTATRWSGAPADGSRACLHEIFAQRARQTPEAVALTCETERLSYGELDRRANRLAHRLLAWKIGRGSRIGLCVERSLNLVIGVLGILKTGAAYVPLDPAYPQERLAFLVEDSGAEALVTEERLRPHLPPEPQERGRVLCLDSDREESEPQSFELPARGATAQDVAYVIYTSGSTGRPKGVAVPHANVVELFAETADRFRFGPEDVWTLFHSFAFDFSVWELWGALLHGGRLVVVPYWVTRSPQAFYELLAQERVTVLNQTPSAFRQLAWAEEEAGAAGRRELALRRVIFGGEALEVGSLRSWFERHGEENPRLVNMYGITETTVHVTYRELGPGDLAAGSVVGRPIPGWRVFLLDSALAPVAPGIPGEIYVGGAGLALGYLRRAELTAARFVPDPWSGEPGSRLYRSGDLARLRPDGDLEYLGRIDDQVKIRGFRIEPGEIEAVLASHPAVREVSVIARGRPGDQRLVAYVAAAEPRPAPEELRELVRRRQPEHMVPAAFVLVDRLPLTPNGKVDRRALPESEAGLDTAAAFAAPRTPFERVLSLLWADLLGLERVGIESNFFALGGDSLRAVRLVSRMNDELGLNLKVQDLFRYPTIAALAEQSRAMAGRISLEEERAAGLKEIERLCRAILADPQQRASLPPEYEDFFPVSGIEKGMAYYSLLLPEEPVYHDQLVYLLRIPDVGVFFEALRLTMERHPVFRTSFHFYTFAEPIKVVHRELRLEQRTEDLTALAAPEQHRRVEEYLASDLERRFTFDGDVLWRFKLLRLRDDVHCAVLSFHHAVLDGWSCASFWVEVGNLCARPDRMVALPPLASSYKDFLAITLGRKSSAETTAFWREMLGGAGRTRLPFNRARVRGTQARGMRILRRRLSGELLAALRSVARAHRVSLRTLTLTAHVWLLHVITADDEVITGVVTHDRPAIKDGDKILGCFLNTLPVRIDVARAAGFAPLLRAVDDYLRRAKEHEILLQDLAAAVGNREKADNPFFDSIFNFIDFHVLAEAALGAGPSVVAGTPEEYRFESREMTNTLFDLEVMTTLGELGVKLKYSPRYFDEADAQRAVELYVRILERLGSDSAARLDPEALLSAAERSEIVDRFNDTRVDAPWGTPVFRLIEARAEETPDHPAVSCAGESLTYGAFNRAANRLARHLMRQGARPGDCIGVIYPRSVDLVVAMTAVLKMGGTYVPIEPDYPPVRKGYIAGNSGVTRILADRPYALDGLPDGAPAFVISEPAELLSHADSDLAVDPRPDQLAYTIYTSGSTGKPKGVMIEHRSVVNLVRWVNRELAVGPETTVLMLSSVCFDLSVYDLFGGLSAGARVVLAREEDVRDPACLKRLLDEERITFWSSVPSTMGLLTEFLEDADPAYRQEDLTAVFLSGDWIPLSLPEKIRTFFPNARVVSLGGATEATVWSIFYPDGHVDEAWASIPYGRPIDNSTVYILDKSLSVVPLGVVGDLYIGGAGVARGYANDPEKTAAAFQPDRFAVDPGARLYRTGDLGRMLPDGNIELLGRADHQVKIRGFRVELGEVESQLLKHPLVREAVVLDKVDSSQAKYLCAYIVAEELPSTPELKAFLASTLPEYMIPSAFIRLPALPRTDNGKLDRRALPDPEVANLSTSAHCVEPAGAVEEVLVEIWEELLGIDGIGTSHDFFELGGHSLLVVQVITRIRRQLGVELPLRALFVAPTVAGLAAEIEVLRAMGAEPRRMPLRRSDRTGPLPLSFAQQRFWFLQQLNPESSAFHLSGAVRLSGRLDIAVLEAAFGKIVRRHAAVRTRFVAVEGVPCQIVDPPGPFLLPRMDLSGLSGSARESELRRVAESAARRPFRLAAEPPLRVLLLRLAEDEHVVLLTLHHIAGDGWSLEILTQELGDLYATGVDGRPSTLPELPVQYVDWAVAHQEWLRGPEAAEQLAWWRRQLGGGLPILAFPMQRQRSAVPRYRGAAVRLALGVDLSAALADLGRSAGVTRFMCLLAAFKALLHLVTGGEDLLVGTNVANRGWPGVEGLIGLFVNDLALRTDLSGRPSFRELLVRVRETVLEAHARQDLPFESIVADLRPERSAGPLFQVMFVLQSFPFSVRELPGLTLTSLETDRRTTNFDLTLTLGEGANGLDGAFVYDVDLFDASTIARLAEHFVVLLREVMADPDRPLHSLSFAPPAAAHQMASAFSEEL